MKNIDQCENFWETIIDSVPGSIYWKNKEGVYLGCNKAMVRKSNFKKKDDIIGKTDRELWPEFSDQICQRDDEVMTLNKTIESQETVTINTGEVLYFASIKKPLKNEQGEIIGMAGNSLDITEIVQAKQRAEAVNHSKTQFILNMQHDIKTPISHIIGLSDILLKASEQSEESKKYVGYIKTSAERLMELMVDVFCFLDIETGDAHEKIETFNLRTMIQSIVELYIIPVNQKKIKLTIDYAGSTPDSLVGDRIKFHRILLNLVDNALKFTKEGSVTIHVQCDQKSDDSKAILKISVEDTGIGIPVEKQEEIFEKFSRLSPSGQNLYKGLGLGLWIVKELVKNLKGTIQVESREGYGACFTCELPIRTSC